MVTVKVVSRATGNPVASARVGVAATGWFEGVHHQYTDNSGEAHFANVSPCDAEVYVNGKTVHKGRLEGRKVVYI